MISKQGLLGLALFIGGGVMVFALAKSDPAGVNAATTQADTSVQAEEISHPTVQPLTTDIETEERILAQKRREREQQAAKAKQETDALLAAQEKARIEAQQKAANEASGYAQQKATNTELNVQTRPEAVALAKQQEAQAAEQKANEQQKAAQQAEQKATEQKAITQKTTNNASTHKVQAGDNLIRLSKQYNIPVSVLAEANNMSRHDALHLGKTIKIPSASEIKALERAAAERVAKEEAERANRQRMQEADARLNTARQTARQQGENGKFAVQVALAANQDNADILANTLKAAGYKVSTSPTSRGVRVVVGPERSREAANALRSKMINDNRIAVKSAWVTELQ
ncbi:MAG: SPOR domain-containing protein [Moraxella sp.]|nr:SPOR domain-containing protein [Moraxella sp.]